MTRYIAPYWKKKRGGPECGGFPYGLFFLIEQTRIVVIASVALKGFCTSRQTLV
jgi:hypothetical protein